jgi:hypothetical protein
MKDDYRCAVCRNVVHRDKSHITVGADELPREAFGNTESYLFQVAYWDSVASGWGGAPACPTSTSRATASMTSGAVGNAGRGRELL